ncbi:putative quinol monooxygenase [Erythrobacter crassostreae]|uniref:Antibiotic biosynthesis monooxygenase n=1 Tax=Erythrobacter crassostreae TaxID=2828328 RepID=A0A9X1F3E1_9SPHN|nr:putative quinol monooxygenase [Erythrobacter crassostrea]MBV7259576.1 antibiotic biosynthesis monooxygenase [Erythrobacter crassostrea]
MLIVVGKAKLGAGALDTGRDALTTMIEASRAEEGCIDYSYATDILDPSTMHIIEKWVDEAALVAHLQTPHMAAFQKALGDLDVKIIEVMKFQADDGAPLM